MQNKVSIIIPCYNNGTTIEETLQSLKVQTHQEWEALFVDDGSSDDTASVIINASEQDNRIIYIQREGEERGGSVCRNIGLECSTGEYVMFLDADDLLSPDCLLNRLNNLEGADYEFAVFTTGTFGTSGILNPYAFPTIRINDKRKYAYLYAGTQAVWHTSSTLFRRNFVVRIGGFDTRYKRLQDIEFHFRAIVESKGKFNVVSGAYTSLYRVTESEGIKYQKFLDSLLSYSMMSDQIDKYLGQGLLEHGKLLSKAYLLLCTRYIRTLCILRLGGVLKEIKGIEKENWMNVSFLTHNHLLVLKTMRQLLGKPSLCLKLCKAVDYLIRKRI